MPQGPACYTGLLTAFDTARALNRRAAVAELPATNVAPPGVIMKLISTLAACGLLLSSVSAASAADRRVDILNKTGMTMTEFYASNTGMNDWEEDILGEDVLENGDSVKVNIDDGSGKCRFDFKAVFKDGQELIRKNINVCQVGTFTYNK